MMRLPLLLIIMPAILAKTLAFHCVLDGLIATGLLLFLLRAITAVSCLEFQ